MKLTRFQTDQRLWMRIALALFVASWLFLRAGIKSTTYVPVVLLWEWIVAIFRADPAREIFGVGATLFLFGCISAITSIFVAWFLHCAVVVVRTKKRERKNRVV
jgi:hypothetical protein